jgi:hypothetical protein
MENRIKQFCYLHLQFQKVEGKNVLSLHSMKFHLFLKKSYLNNHESNETCRSMESNHEVLKAKPSAQMWPYGATCQMWHSISLVLGTYVFIEGFQINSTT